MISTLWKQYCKNRTDDLRNKIIEHYLPDAKDIAYRIAKKYPKNICRQDILCAANLGLLRAVEHFDPARSNDFKAFAAARIRGEIIDWFRSINTKSRKLQVFQTKAWNIDVDIDSEKTADQQIAEKLGMTIRRYLYLKKQLATDPIPFSVITTNRKESPDFDRKDTSSSGCDPSLKISQEHLMLLLSKILTRQEFLTIVLYFWGGKTLKQIGEVIHCSESRTSQIKNQTLVRLKIAMEIDQRLNVEEFYLAA